jgi:ABC-2 type transport system ATP-binding protein
MNAGKLAAMGTSAELKRTFELRPIIEIHSGHPVEVMRALEDHADVEKTTVFGTAVHAVLRTPAVSVGALSAGLAARGLSVDSVERIMPSLEDVFLDVVEHA